MIVRRWRGATRAADADRYLAYLEATGLREYRSLPGNRGVLLLRRALEDQAEFVLLSFWESEDAIRAFSGNDIRVARFYPDDSEFLVDSDRHADHFQLPFASLAPGLLTP